MKHFSSKTFTKHSSLSEHWNAGLYQYKEAPSTHLRGKTRKEAEPPTTAETIKCHGPSTTASLLWAAMQFGVCVWEAAPSVPAELRQDTAWLMGKGTEDIWKVSWVRVVLGATTTHKHPAACAILPGVVAIPVTSATWEAEARWWQVPAQDGQLSQILSQNIKGLGR